MCASIYILLFGMLNSNKLYLLAFFIFKLLYGLYLICKCTHTFRISSHSPIFFTSGTTLSFCVLVCKNTGTYTDYLMPKGPQCEYVCVCSNSYLKSLSQLKTKFTWNQHVIGETFIQMIRFSCRSLF